MGGEFFGRKSKGLISGYKTPLFGVFAAAL